MSAVKAHAVMREIGRAHNWGSYLYEVSRGGVVIAKISATPEDAKAMLAGLNLN